MQESVARLRAKVHAGESLSAAEHEAWYGTSSSSTGKRRKEKKGRRKSSRRLLFLVVGVPVIFSDKFQQLFEFFVPQVQFLDRMVDIPVVQQRQVLTVFFSVLIQFLNKVILPVLRIDSDLVRQCRKPCWCCSCSSSKVDGFPSCRRGKSPWSCLFRKP